MLNIQLTRFKNNINFNKSRKANNNNNNNNINKNNLFSIKNTKLAPLSHDTISFSGSSAKLNRSLFEAFDNISTCTQIKDDAKPAMAYLKNTLETALDPFLATKANPHRPIETISTRIKTPESIREKAADKLESAITAPEPWAFNPNTTEGIKGTVGDIIGARIILRKSDIKQTSQIIGILIDLVEQGKLKITKIESYVPANEQTNLKYFQDSDLEKLKNAVNKNKEANQQPIEVINKTKKTGYTALHLDVDLSDPDYKARNNNYKGEIQILGYDVAQLKDIEDFCYKMKVGKDIKGRHYAFVPLSQHFKKLYENTQDYPNLKQDYELYTSRAYSIQRAKEPLNPNNKKRKNTLPTIEECGLKGRIPQGLDFNVLSSIVQCCNKIYEIANSTT